MIGIKITSNLSRLKSTVERAMNDAIPDALAAVEEAIKKNTAQGLDADGNPMPAYSTRWAQVREKAGLPTDKRYLRYTRTLNNAPDSLMNSFQSATLRGRGKLGIAEVAMDKAQGNNDRAQFFAVGEKLEADIVDIVNSHIQSALTK